MAVRRIARRRMTGSLPVIDIDGSLWSVFAECQGPNASVMIQICSGFDSNDHDGSIRTHQFDGGWHEGDTHLFLDNDAASRLLSQLREAFDGRNAGDEINWADD